MLFVFDWGVASIVLLQILVLGCVVILHLVAVYGFLFVIVKVRVVGRNKRLSTELTSCFTEVRLTLGAFNFAIEFSGIL